MKGFTRLKESWKNVRRSGNFKNFLIFLIFVGIAFIFWAVMTADQETQEKFQVEVRIVNAPDSVTFINNPPDRIQVLVKDKGTHLMRHALNNDMALNLNFSDFSQDDRFIVTKNELVSAIKNLFGNAASISSLSVDSISCRYTTAPGRKVPIKLNYDVTATQGMIVMPDVRVSTNRADVFSLDDQDTLKVVNSQKITLRDLDKTTTVQVKLISEPGFKIVPQSIRATFIVEPLVKKESSIKVIPDNIPLGQDILFFPSKVKVVYYVPMSLYSEEDPGIQVKASFREADLTSSDKVGLWVDNIPPYMKNVELLSDSVNYTIVK